MKEILNIRIKKQLKLKSLGNESEQAINLTSFDIQIYNIVQRISANTLIFTTYDVWNCLFDGSKQQVATEELNTINLSIFKLNSTFLNIETEIIGNGKPKKTSVGGTLLSACEFLPYKDGIQFSYKTRPICFDTLSRDELKELQKIIEEKQ